MKLNLAQEPSLELYSSVRSVFIMRNKTLGRWCKENDICPVHAKDALLGRYNSEKSKNIRTQVLAMAKKLATSTGK